MDKVNHGLIWSNQHADGTITVGFTKKCIEEKLAECFHVFQADTKEVREKGPLLVLETNDGLQSIKAPFAGKVSYFNPKARNFPDRIKEEETIVTIIPEGVKIPVKAAPKAKTVQVNSTGWSQLFNAEMPIFNQPVQEAAAVREWWQGQDPFTTGPQQPPQQTNQSAPAEPIRTVEDTLREARVRAEERRRAEAFNRTVRGTRRTPGAR